MKFKPLSAISGFLSKNFTTKSIDLEIARIDVSLTRASGAFAQNEYQPHQEDRQDFSDAVAWNIKTRGAAASSYQIGYSDMVDKMADELVKRRDMQPDEVEGFKKYAQECLKETGDSWKRIVYQHEIPHFISFTKTLSDGSPDLDDEAFDI